ncbi:DUF3800 domain-containing protein [Tabrizicola sp. TH137]|uniref:DUF3800 domain-containing protein n=1 Tax=Tabrizicola sp. TH137 TaxID=2067452 RepID=UPI000C7D99BC|nr:DUF3800 domain-containing protein [Tabrizicola sp. TH137]PLL11975.1 DUF3800 domain-containing protein [Tabrizicola sp. TH137]
MAAVSRYIVYADESGSPNLEADTKHFPIFVLTFLIVEKDVYARQVEPDVTSFKFRHFGHDQVILHESDIRKQRGPFAFLRADPALRQGFLAEVGSLAARRDIAFECAIVDKSRVSHAQTAWSPYDIALGICMEQTALRLMHAGETSGTVHVVFEARGRKEDELLELEFHRVAAGQAKVRFGDSNVQRFNWVPVFSSKQTNSAGLQLADLAARPIGLSYLRPHQSNRAFSALRTTSAAEGVKIYP